MPRPAALLLCLALLLTACNGDGRVDAADLQTARERLVDIARDAVKEAKERNAQQTGEVDRRPAADGTVLRTDTRTAFDYQEYQQTIETVIGSLEQFWAAELPRIGGRYSAPSRYVYYRPEEAPGPSCGGEQAPARNAFYCPPGDFIAWDESGLMIPYYVSGDFAAAFVLAHEFGHAMQVRLPRQETVGVLRELQADCFAGAWARHVQDQGLLEAGDLDEATIAVFQARDVPGTPFTDPQAHGTGFERTRAFTDGYDEGAASCAPAPADDWLVGRS
ncbi:MAG: LpqM protein [Frankiales bacterium]|nr:LpqM protein [Frankiales bacterium]